MLAPASLSVERLALATPLLLFDLLGERLGLLTPLALLLAPLVLGGLPTLLLALVADRLPLLLGLVGGPPTLVLSLLLCVGLPTVLYLLLLARPLAAVLLVSSTRGPLLTGLSFLLVTPPEGGGSVGSCLLRTGSASRFLLFLVRTLLTHVLCALGWLLSSARLVLPLASLLPLTVLLSLSPSAVSLELGPS